MDSANSQHDFFFEQPSLSDKTARWYYIQVINALHQYDIFQAKENLRQCLPIDEEMEETTKHVIWNEEITYMMTMKLHPRTTQ